ncbi:MAG: glycine cleavage T C-terminal barrel domain-containing protein, partial [Streptosporangiaceae bacterium]
RRLASFVVSDPQAYAWGGELLLRGGEPVGFVSSAAFGHSLGRTVLLGYVERRDGGTADREWLGQGAYQVAVGGQRYDADLTLRPPFDPAGMRIRS